MTCCWQLCFQTTKYIENSKLHASRRNVCHFKNDAMIDFYEIQFRQERQMKELYYKGFHLPNLLIVISIQRLRLWTHSLLIQSSDKYFNITIVNLLLSSLSRFNYNNLKTYFGRYISGNFVPSLKTNLRYICVRRR